MVKNEYVLGSVYEGSIERNTKNARNEKSGIDVHHPGLCGRCGAKPNAPELAAEQNGKENSWRD